MIRIYRWLCCLGLLAAAVSLVRAEDKKEARGLELTKDEQTLLDLINKERSKKELPPLQPNTVLFEVARGHSANMARQMKMEHELDGKNPGQRILGAGYDYGRATENIAMADGPGVPLTRIVSDWMKSEIHRNNILDPKVKETGLGLATNDKGEVYYAQVFARPRKVIKKRD